MPPCHFPMTLDAGALCPHTRALMTRPAKCGGSCQKVERRGGKGTTMKSPGQHRIRIFEINFRAVTIALTLTLLFASVAVLTPAAQAQTFNVIHTFTGAGDGGSPSAGVTFDKAEKNLYGTTYYYGTHGYGAVYQLKQKQGKWTVNPLYSFAGGKDGAYPQARVIFGPDGSLYGTTDEGGSSNLGTVFKLRPPASACKTALCAWTETELYAFKGSADGAYPGLGDLLFDQGGNIYGTTVNGGSPHNIGVVYELTPSGPSWTESVLYSFSGNDGATPWSNVTFDSAGNLYGTTDVGGLYSSGTAFQLMPSMGGWTENILNNW